MNSTPRIARYVIELFSADQDFLGAYVSEEKGRATGSYISEVDGRGREASIFEWHEVDDVRDALDASGEILTVKIPVA